MAARSWGNFIEVDGLNTGRFLDPPEFAVFHDKGNEENIFDRVDYTFTPADSIHLDLNYSRSWFQTPNSFDNLNVQNVVQRRQQAPIPTFANVGNTDQRSKIGTFNISPTYTRIISNDSVFNLGAFVRRDGYNYYPSGNPLADLGREPANLVHLPVPHAYQRRRPRRLLLCQGSQQPQDRRAIRANVSARERQPWNRGIHL